MKSRIVKVIVYFRQKAILFLISRNYSIKKLISFPKKVKKRPCSEINASMNRDPVGVTLPCLLPCETG